MNEIILLLILSAFSIIGLWCIFNKYNDTDEVKKIAAVFIGVMIIGSTVFLIFSAETRNIAMMNGEQTQSTIDILLSWNHGGYSPFVKTSWGGTGPNENFDWDSLINQYDPDADNDGVEDYKEFPLRFNPYQPDIGIQDVGIQWIDDDTIKVIATPVTDITGLDFTVTLFVNNKIQEYQSYEYLTNEMTFVVDIDPSERNIIELRSEGEESDYANQANNLVSYTIAAGVTGVIFQVYYDIENQLQGVIRNSPLFQSTNGVFSSFENLFRNTLAGIPLVVWIGIVFTIIVLLFVSWRRRKKGKPSLFRRKKGNNQPGDIGIKFY